MVSHVHSCAQCATPTWNTHAASSNSVPVCARHELSCSGCDKIPLQPATRGCQSYQRLAHGACFSTVNPITPFTTNLNTCTCMRLSLTPPPHPRVLSLTAPHCAGCLAPFRFDARSEFSNPTPITSVSSDPASQLQVCLWCVLGVLLPDTRGGGGR